MGIDIIFDAATLRARKMVLHSNAPGHYDFGIYARAQFALSVSACVSRAKEMHEREASIDSHGVTRRCGNGGSVGGSSGELSRGGVGGGVVGGGGGVTALSVAVDSVDGFCAADAARASSLPPSQLPSSKSKKKKKKKKEAASASANPTPPSSSLVPSHETSTTADRGESNASSSIRSSSSSSGGSGGSSGDSPDDPIAVATAAATAHTKTIITPIARFKDVVRALGVQHQRPVAFSRAPSANSTNPFGTMSFYRVGDCIFEVSDGAGDCICGLTMFAS